MTHIEALKKILDRKIVFDKDQAYKNDSLMKDSSENNLTFRILK
jgi:hypothetical protein